MLSAYLVLGSASHLMALVMGPWTSLVCENNQNSTSFSARINLQWLSRWSLITWLSRDLAFPFNLAVCAVITVIVTKQDCEAPRRPQGQVGELMKMCKFVAFSKSLAALWGFPPLADLVCKNYLMPTLMLARELLICTVLSYLLHCFEVPVAR